MGRTNSGGPAALGGTLRRSTGGSAVARRGGVQEGCAAVTWGGKRARHGDALGMGGSGGASRFGLKQAGYRPGVGAIAAAAACVQMLLFRHPPPPPCPGPVDHQPPASCSTRWPSRLRCSGCSARAACLARGRAPRSWRPRGAAASPSRTGQVWGQGWGRARGRVRLLQSGRKGGARAKQAAHPAVTPLWVALLGCA